MLRIAELSAAPARELGYRFSVEQYHRMIAVGIFPADDRTELLEGQVVAKMSRNPPHDETLTRLNRRLARLLPDEWLVRVQSALTLKDSEPEPDIAIVRGPEGAYSSRHPRPRDVGLLIEVADSSLMGDRRYKGQLYAQARIAGFWIVNLVEGRFEVYSSPRGGRRPQYQERQDYGKDARIPLHFANQEFGQLAAKELLP